MKFTGSNAFGTPRIEITEIMIGIYQTHTMQTQGVDKIVARRLGGSQKSGKCFSVVMDEYVSS
jgi:hypothetical protein